eukprot:scaffold144840_cov133-Phaeocystis_antarctica.AAC.2
MSMTYSSLLQCRFGRLGLEAARVRTDHGAVLVLVGRGAGDTDGADDGTRLGVAAQHAAWHGGKRPLHRGAE